MIFISWYLLGVISFLFFIKIVDRKVVVIDFLFSLTLPGVGGILTLVLVALLLTFQEWDTWKIMNTKLF